MSEPPDLAGAPWLTAARPILLALGGQDHQTRIVGGAVRDTLLGLGRPVADIDMASVLLPQAVMARAEAAGLTVHPTGIAHGTVTVVSGLVRAEVTTLRADVATDGRRAKVRFGTDWVEDAARRDFTMNALYADGDGRLFDPLGALDDCLARRVRFVGDADIRIAEDRLRVLRFFRFCASHGHQTFDPVGLAACRRAGGDLGPVSGERIGQEMMRLLAAPRVARTLAAMHAVDLFPTLALEATGVALLTRAEEEGLTSSALARLAILAVDEAGLARVQGAWRLSRATVRAAGEIQDWLGLATDENWNRLRYSAGDQAPAMVDLALAIGFLGADAGRAGKTIAAEGMAPEFPLTGADVLAAGLASGPDIGRALAALEQAWVDSGFSLSREALLRRLPGR